MALGFDPGRPVISCSWNTCNNWICCQLWNSKDCMNSIIFSFLLIDLRILLDLLWAYILSSKWKFIVLGQKKTVEFSKLPKILYSWKFAHGSNFPVFHAFVFFVKLTPREWMHCKWQVIPPHNNILFDLFLVSSLQNLAHVPLYSWKRS